MSLSRARDNPDKMSAFVNTDKTYTCEMQCEITQTQCVLLLTQMKHTHVKCSVR